MKSLRRYNQPDHPVFITVVTFERTPILLRNHQLFSECWSGQNLVAWVVLPDHFHAIIEPGALSISDVLHRFKIKYSRRFRDLHGPGRVWQNRFWDHVIRDQNDMNHHIDYIHYNPVKHGLAKNPFEWTHSSIDRYLKDGYYDRSWGNITLEFDGLYGE